MSSSGDDETWATRVREICVRWNEAEGMIKVAEQVNGEIINPAIYELRYAGRRIVEALKCHEEGDIDKRNNLLHDADFDCCRAKHDAIDAITAKVANDMALATKKLGEDNVLQHFPNMLRNNVIIRNRPLNRRVYFFQYYLKATVVYFFNFFQFF